MPNRRGRILCAVAVAALALPVTLEGQVQRMRSVDGTNVKVEVAKAFISRSAFSWYTSVARARMLRPFGEGTALLADWGVSLAGSPRGSGATLLNPEIGIALVDSDDDEMSGFMSVILPLSRQIGDEVSSIAGFLTDFAWPDRYTDEVWSVNGGLTPSIPLSSDEATRGSFELVASALIPREGQDREIVARYALGVSRDLETVRLRADLLGFATVTESDLDFGERTTHELSFGIDGIEGGPGGFVRVPLDEEFVARADLIVGLTYTF